MAQVRLSSIGIGKAKRETTGTEILQIAKEKLRQFESARVRGEESLLPTKTPIATILTAYIEEIRTAKTAKSAQTDIYYLRDAFGPVCEGLKITSRKLSPLTKKRPPKKGQDRRRKAQAIEANRVVITSDSVTQVYLKDDSRGWKYTIDPSKNPKQMDWLIEETPGQTILNPAIYSLDGDTLKIASAAQGKPRPTNFKSKKGDFGGVWILKRVVPAPAIKAAK